MRDIRALPLPQAICLWQAVYDRNVSAVESFTLSLMTSLSGAGSAKAGSASPARGSMPPPYGEPLCPGRCFGAAASPNAPRAKTTA